MVENPATKLPTTATRPAQTCDVGIAVYASDAWTDAVKNWLTSRAFANRPDQLILEVQPLSQVQTAPEPEAFHDWSGEIDHCVTAVLVLPSKGHAFENDATGPGVQGLDYSARYFLTLMSICNLRQIILVVAGDDTAGVEGSGWQSLQNEIKGLARQLNFDREDMVALCADNSGALLPLYQYPETGGRELFPLQAAFREQCLEPAVRETSISEPSGGPLRWLVSQDNDADRSQVKVKPVSGRVDTTEVCRNSLVVLPGAVDLTVNAVTGTSEGNLELQLGSAISLKSGQVITIPDERPEVADQMAVNLIWTASQPMLPGRPYLAVLNGQQAVAQISTLKHKIDVQTQEHIAVSKLGRGEIGYCNLSLDKPFAFDPHHECRPCGRMTLLDKQTGDKLGTALIVHPLRRASNIHWQSLAVDREARAALKGQQPCCLWFTGLSGSGKSTVASLLEKRLQSLGRHTYTLDGDNVRHGLNRDLGFTVVDRVENIRRIGEVSKLFVEAGLIVMCSFISPFRSEREMVRDLFDRGEFIEIFVDTPLELCEKRDIKGLYKKARAGQLVNFTGIDSPYERPENPDIVLEAGALDPEAMVEDMLRELRLRALV